MAQAKNKTVATKVSPASFIDGLPDESVRDDCRTLVKIMSKASGEEAKMWGSAIIGFGTYHFKYDSGREGDFLIVGFSPRKANLSLYLGCDLKANAKLFEKLGRYKTSGGCLHIKRLADVDLKVLEQLVGLGMKAKAQQRVK
jgi:Domain of unknown function (DU1801)